MGGALPRGRARLRRAVEQRIVNLPPARRLRLQLATEALRRFGASRELAVLDAGCGLGLLAVQLARRHPRWKIAAVDLDPDTLVAARARARAAGIDSIRFARADLTQELGRGAYDAIAALDCLTEIPDADAALERMVAALRPGGLFLAHVPERDWKPVLRGSRTAWKDAVRQGYSSEELKTKLEDLGLDVTRVAPTTRATAQTAQEVRERIKDSSLKVRAAAYPVMAGAVWLERRGVTWGSPRGLLVEARKPG